jgi:hypothetical protein
MDELGKCLRWFDFTEGMRITFGVEQLGNSRAYGINSRFPDTFTLISGATRKIRSRFVLIHSF